MNGFNSKRLLSKTDTYDLKVRIRAVTVDQGMTYQHVADITGLSYATIRNGLGLNANAGGVAIRIANHFGVALPA